MLWDPLLGEQWVDCGVENVVLVRLTTMVNLIQASLESTAAVTVVQLVLSFVVTVFQTDLKKVLTAEVQTVIHAQLV